MGIASSILEDLIPGVGQAKLAIIGGIALALVLAVGGTIGYYKYQNVKLENTVLSKQNDLDNAKNVIAQQKSANDSLAAGIAKQKEDIKTIVHEQVTARDTDTKTQAAKDALSQNLTQKIDTLNSTTDDSYNEEAEKFLKAYNDNLECRRQNPNNLTACTQ